MKCKVSATASKKKEKAEALPEGSKAQPTPFSPQQRKDQDLENANFSSLRSERDRIKYIRMMAEKKIKVQQNREGGKKVIMVGLHAGP